MTIKFNERQVYKYIYSTYTVSELSKYLIEEVKIWPCENVKNAENLRQRVVLKSKI